MNELSTPSAEENRYEPIVSIVIFVEVHISILIQNMNLHNTPFALACKLLSGHFCSGTELLSLITSQEIVFEHLRHLKENTSNGSIITLRAAELRDCQSLFEIVSLRNSIST